MSYEPTQPMTPPSTSLTDEGGEDPGRESQDDPAQHDPAQHDPAQDDPAQDDAAQDDAAQAATPKCDSGQVTAPEGGVSQATIPRAVLSQASVPAPPGNAQQSDAPQSDAPQSDAPRSDGSQDDAPQADWGQGDAPQDYGPQSGWGQGSGPQGDWDQGNAPRGYEQHGYEQQGYEQHGYEQHGYEQQGYEQHGYAPQGYRPEGYGPEGDWDQGNAEHGYGAQGYGPQGYGSEDGPPSRPRRRRRPVRRSVIALFVLLVIAIMLVIANFVGQAIAENDMANQFTANGFPVRPSVDIEGFPFLTQVAAKDFKKVVISASNIPAGPVTISSLHATVTGMHLNSSWSGATFDHVTATAFVSLSSLTGGISSELGDAVSLTAVPDGTNKLKVTGTVLGLSGSGVVEIKQTGPQQITVELPTTGGLVGMLGSAASFTITLPAGVPPSLRITGLTLNGQGLTLSASATNATFSK